MGEVERVIQYIRSCRKQGIDTTISICLSKSHLILNALEKQTPRSLQISKDSRGDSYDYTCHCGRRIISKMGSRWIAGQLLNYCPRCGQAIKWEEC